MATLSQETTTNSSARSLQKLFEEAWEYDLKEEPVRASHLGDRRWNDRWPDVSLPAIERRHAHNKEILAALERIDRAALSPGDRVSYDLFAREYKERLEEFSHKTFLVPFDQRSGVHSAHELAKTLRFESAKDYLDWLARLKALPKLLDDTIQLLREGIRARKMQPKVIVERVLGQLEKLLAAKGESSPFYAPFASLRPSVTPAEGPKIQREAIEAISSKVLPALQRFREFLQNEYLAAAPAAVGLWQWPEGENTYAFLARKFTTTTLTPLQIHEIGLGEVQRIRGEMELIKEKTAFKGTLKEFFGFLRSDPRFFFKTPGDLLLAYRAMAKRIDPAMVKVLRKLPRVPYGVEPIPEITAPDTTAAYYMEPAADGSRGGSFYVNLYKPEMRPKHEMMALSLHEAVPGHHLQIALAMELDLPSFRRYGGYTAFVEGWALYAEALGDELGLYDDPYSKFGQLTYEIWRAVRLVVDTGIHVFRWDRQKAIEFFLDNAAKTEVDVVNEIDRYIGWPGQALAYKIGELKIKELRRWAEKKLAGRFDLRDFHEVLLNDGAVTLDVLENKVEEWLGQKAARGQ
jgi:uncharacterized protein (DUF885 family)